MEELQRIRAAYETYLIRREECREMRKKELLVGLCIFLALAAGGFAFRILLAFAAVILMIWPITVQNGYHARLRWLNRGMDIEIMTGHLTEAFGAFVLSTVQGTILQMQVSTEGDLYRLAWDGAEKPFRLYLTTLNCSDDAEDARRFSGLAVSIPLQQPLELEKEKRCAIAQNIQKHLKKEGNARRVLFSIDELDGRLWLTTGFQGRELRADEPLWEDVEAWQEQCRQSMPEVKTAIEEARRLAEMARSQIDETGMREERA